MGVSYDGEDDYGYYSSNHVENNTYSPQFTLNISGTGNDREMERKVKRWITESLDEVFESMGRKNPKIQEV